MNEQVVVTYVLTLAVARQDHVASHSQHQRDDALSHYLLQVLPLNQSCKQLNKILCHAFYTLRVILVVAFKTPLNVCTSFRLI
jgi:hypothetical protein